MTIRLERTGCYGSCPAYTVTIHGDGSVDYNGEMYVKVEGNQSAHIPPDSVRQLVGEFLVIDWFNMVVDERLIKAMDTPSTITSLTIGPRTRTIVDKPIEGLDQRIDQMANTEQWTGAEEEERRYQRWLDSIRIARPDEFRH